jgi:hypothetical protein
MTTSTDNRYVAERLRRAVGTLAASRGSIQERLHAAYLYDLSGIELEQVADSARARYEELSEALTSEDQFIDEGKVAATLNVMEDDRAYELAEKICDLEATYSE